MLMFYRFGLSAAVYRYSYIAILRDLFRVRSVLEVSSIPGTPFALVAGALRNLKGGCLLHLLRNIGCNQESTEKD